MIVTILSIISVTLLGVAVVYGFKFMEELEKQQEKLRKIYFRMDVVSINNFRKEYPNLSRRKQDKLLLEKFGN